MAYDLSGRVAIVHGAPSGIGAASARALAECGPTVVLADRDAAGAAGVVRSLVEAGNAASFVHSDVTNEAGVDRLVRETVERYGRCDIAHSNAGISDVNVPLTEVETSNWQRHLAINLTGIFLCMRAQLLHMESQSRGSIINTASTAGVRCFPNLAPYVASKFGVIGITKSAALENRKHGVASIRSAWVRRSPHSWIPGGPGIRT